MQNLDPITALAPHRKKPNVKNMQMQKRIGSTIYSVLVCFSDNAKETMNDKILRLARYDAENLKEAAGL
jgi:hypothetical protein